MASEVASPVVCKVKFASLEHLHRVVLSGADKSVKLREEVLRLCAQNKLGPDVTLTYGDNKDQTCVISNLPDLENALSFSSVKGLTVKVTVHHLPQPVCQLNFPHWPGHTYLVSLTDSAQSLSEADPDRLWSRLLDECARLYKLKTDSAAPLSASAFTLTFLDEEGDCCLMSCAAEFQEALELASINRMPLKVFAAESKDCQLDVSPRPVMVDAEDVKVEGTPGADVAPSTPAPAPAAEPTATAEEEESDSDADSDASDHEAEQPLDKPEDEESFSECETSEDEDGWLLEEYGGSPFDRKPVVRRSNQPKPGRGPRAPRSVTLPVAPSAAAEPAPPLVASPAPAPAPAPAPVASPPPQVVSPVPSPAPAPVAAPVPVVAVSAPATVMPVLATLIASPAPVKIVSVDVPKMAPSPAALPVADPILVAVPSNDAPLVTEVPAEMKSPALALVSLSVDPSPKPSAPPASALDHYHQDPAPSAPALPSKAPAAPVPAVDEANGTALLDTLDYIACVNIGAPELFPSFAQYVGEYKLSGNVVVLRNRMMWLLRNNDDLRNGFDGFLANLNKVPFEALGLDAKAPKDAKDARSALDCGVLFHPGVPGPAPMPALPAYVPVSRRGRRNRNKRRVHFDVPNQPQLIRGNIHHYPLANVNVDLPKVSFGGDRSPARVAPALAPAPAANPPVLDLARFNKWYSKVSQLQAMGFSCPAHDPSFLVDLLEAVNGDVDKAIDILAADQ